MRSHKVRASMLAIAIVLSACASVPTIESVNPNSLSNEQAIIAFTLGDLSYNAGCVFWVQVSVDLQLVIDESRGRTVTPFFGITSYMDEPQGRGFTEEDHAKVHALVVEPGEYRFYVTPVMSHLWEYDSRPETHTFGVGPGEIKFVGGLYATSCRGSMEIRDTSVRDVPKLRELSPEIDLDQVTVEIVRFKAEED